MAGVFVRLVLIAKILCAVRKAKSGLALGNTQDLRVAVAKTMVFAHDTPE